MPTIKIRDPKGLYTSHDETDLSFEYFKLAENWRFRDGFMETMFYKLEDYTPDINFYEDENILFYGAVNFNNDPLGVSLVNGELKSNYVYNIVDAELIITRRTVGAYFLYNVFVREGNGAWFVPPNVINNPAAPSPDYELLKDFDKILKDVDVFYNNGVVKIFLPHETLWLGKINRKSWVANIGIWNNYYLTRLVEPYDSNNLGVTYNGGQIPITSPGRRIGVTFDTELTTVNYNETKEVRIVYANEEGIGATGIRRGTQLWQWYRKYNVYTIDEPGTVVKTLLINSQSATNKEPPQLNFMKFQRDNTDEIFDQNPDNIWLYDNVYKNGNVLAGPPISGGTIFYKEDVDPGSGNPTPIGLEEWSAQGILTIKKLFDVEERGFAPTFDSPEIIITAVYDNADEFVIGHKKLTIEESTKYFIKISNVQIPYDSIKRVSVLNVYFKKHKDETDYEQVKSYNLLAREEVDITEEWVLDSLSPNGIFMNQTIGIVFNFTKHELIDVMDDYEIANGISYCLRENTLHYPAIGSGKVSENIFYKQHFIPNLSEDKIISISNVKEALTVHTKKGLKLVLVQDLQVGELFFIIKDTIGYTIEKEISKQVTPDGIFLLTKQGIIFTTGQNDSPVSKPIDDVVEKYYKTGGIFYNEVEKELWFFTGDGDKIYIFNFQYKKWSTVDVDAYGALNISKIFLNNNNEIIVKAQNSLFKVIPIETGIAQLNTQAMDLEDMASWKTLISVLVDFKGKVSYLTNPAVEKTLRDQHIFDIKLDNRIPVHKIGAKLIFHDTGRFYGMEIEYDDTGDGSW